MLPTGHWGTRVDFMDFLDIFQLIQLNNPDRTSQYVSQGFLMRFSLAMTLSVRMSACLLKY